MSSDAKKGCGTGYFIWDFGDVQVGGREWKGGMGEMEEEEDDEEG